DLALQIDHLRQTCDSYLRIQQTAPASIQLANARADLAALIAELTEDIRDLQASIAAVQPTPARFGLTPEQLRQRISFVDSASSDIRAVENILCNPVSRVPVPPINPAPLTQQTPLLPDSPRNDVFQLQQHDYLMREQDSQLESVHTTVRTIRDQATSMGRELQDHQEHPPQSVSSDFLQDPASDRPSRRSDRP
ncbi:t-SNARE affecting a late Golgi compartment protein 1, partial [Neolecta irregularis DAH-3]